jgi:acetyl esterase/lipase
MLAAGLAAPALAEPAVKDKLVAQVQDVGGPFDLKMDVYLPAAKGAPTPLVLYLHGKGGSYNQARDPIAQRVAGMTASGFAVARIDYRPSGRMPGMLFDAKAYIRYFRAHAAEYNVDPHRIAVWGVSRGGNLAAMLAASGDVKALEGDVGGNVGQSSRVDAAVIFFPLTDIFLNTDPKVAEMLPQYLGTSDAQSAEIIRAYKAHDTKSPSWKYVEQVEAVNPMNYIDKNSPPALITCGSNDTGNPIVNSSAMYDKYVEKGVAASFYMYSLGTHGHVGEDIETASVEWLERHLPPP